MPLTREIETISHVNFFKPIRAIFSGSSQSGKTHLVGEILKKQYQLFGSSFDMIKYYYPEYLDECPVQWHTEIDTAISYEPGFPTVEDIRSLPGNSLLIIDDNMKKVVQSELMRQVFNVISGKRNISVICITQNYFTQGKYSRDIRNSSNYVALFRNCADASLNTRVARAFGLLKAYSAAENNVFDKNIYPYVFVDQTQRAQLSSYRVYIDILSKVKIAYNSQGMKGYILNEKDFNSVFKIVSEREKSVTAIHSNADKKSDLRSEESRSTVGESTRKVEKKKRKRVASKSIRPWTKYHE